MKQPTGMSGGVPQVCSKCAKPLECGSALPLFYRRTRMVWTSIIKRRPATLSVVEARNLLALIIVLIAALISPASTWVDNRFASRVVSWTTLGGSPYDDPNASVGKPSTWIQGFDHAGGAGVIATSLVYAAYLTAPDGTTKLVTTVGTGIVSGEIILEFNDPVQDDPANWYGMDFIVYGNSIFKANSPVLLSSDMETFSINNGTNNSGPNEPLAVSVSPDLINWYAYASPKADSFWPTNAFAWDWTTHNWGEELDWTKPCPMALLSTDFAGKYVAQAIDLYQGSAGGAAFDLAQSGFSSIKYVKLSGFAGEVDGIARVSSPLSAGRAKQVPDGIPVSLAPHIVTAGTADFGDCFYVESPDGSSGIKVVGKPAARDTIVTLTGVMSTVASERVIRAAWIETGDTDVVTPVGMPNRALGGGDFYRQPDVPSVGQKGINGGTGLNNIGLLVKTWGQVKSTDSATSTFTISDGSTSDIKCSAPAGVDLPEPPSYVSVTGIVSCEESPGGLLPLLRVRDANDIVVVTGP